MIIILSDDAGYADFGFTNNALAPTPHLDRLAARGVRFDAAYTNCPICVPARASLATGRYVHEIGYWDNAFPYDGRVPAWGHRLIENGHRCDAIGKLHYRSAADNDELSLRVTGQQSGQRDTAEDLDEYEEHQFPPSRSRKIWTLRLKESATQMVFFESTKRPPGR